MKKLPILLLPLIGIFMFSYTDYGSCLGMEGQKALTCGSCHGGSISNDIFILDGKTEEGAELIFDYVVRIPTTGFDAIQLSSSGDKNPKVEFDLASELRENGEGTIFNRVNFLEKTSIENGVQGVSTEVKFTFDEPITKPTVVVIQGVLSNQDGTVNGDRSFYKEVVLQPAEKKESLSAESIANQKLDAYYYEQNLFLDAEEANVLRVINMEGKVVADFNVHAASNQLDLSALNKGVYYAVLGFNSRNLQSMTFIKK